MQFITGAVQGAVTGLPPKFQDGICECTNDTGICLQTICCPLCTLANIQTKRDTGIPACDTGACCAIMWFWYFTGSELPIAMAFAFRRGLVQRYGILEESVCKSCCLSLWCAPCTFCQVQREMSARGEHAGGCCANPPPNAILPGVAQMGAKLATTFIAGGGQVNPNFSTGVCGCSGMECVEGFFCPCIIMGFVNNKLDTGRLLTKPPGTPNGLDPLTCCAWLWMPLANTYANRREVIEKYSIMTESHTMTCCNIYCCTLCAVCQQRREMGYRGDWPGGVCVKDFVPKA